MESIRWGIIGTGAIATKFATGLQSLPDAELIAIGSRSAQGATTFADAFSIPHRHASYDALVADPDVDVVYVATPHTGHRTETLRCLAAGKPVLCEKPFAMNAAEATDMVALARERGIFLMEAMWSRFLPAAARFHELIAEGAIGEPRMLTVDFGFRAGGDPQHRLFNPELGGGSLLDVGPYVTSLASWIFGAPEQITGIAHLGPTGVDEQSAITFGYADGQLAQLTTAVRTNTPHEATLMGTDGWIRIESSWWKATQLTLATSGQSPEKIDLPFDGNGYNYEAAEVMRCLREGLTESPTMPLDETLAIMATLDTIRGQWGLTYPSER